MRARVELALAALRLIQNTPPDELAHLAATRHVTPVDGWSVYDLAKALTEPSAVWHHLVGCERHALQALVALNRDGAAAQISPELAAEPGLVFQTESLTWDIWPDVAHSLDMHAAVVEQALAHEPSSDVHSGPPETTLASASEALPLILDTLAGVSWVVEGVRDHPTTTRLGSPAALAKTLSALDPSRMGDVDQAAVWAIEAGLCVHRSGSWWVTEQGRVFSGEDPAGQLALLIDSWWESAPPGLSTVASSPPHPPTIVCILDGLTTRFPLSGRAEAERWLRLGEDFGVFVAGIPTAFFAALLSGRFSREVVAEYLPPTHTTVYPDGVDALVSAGPLVPEVRATLRTIAHETRGGMAPRFSVDTDSILRSLTTTDQSTLLANLDAVIVGGVPDHLRHTIMDMAERASSLGVTSRNSVTEVECRDDYLAELLTLDNKVTTLGLTQVSPTTLTTGTPASVVRNVLAAAGYPTFPDTPPAPAPRVWSEDVGAGVDRSWWEAKVTEAGTMSHTQVWWEEIIRDAIAERTALSLCVAVGDEKRWMVVEPRSLSGGRLRVSDTVSDVERTLPVNLIIALDIPQA